MSAAAPAVNGNGVDKEGGQWTHDTHRNSLSRQMTVALTPQQYERLFFQPTAAKGDLSRRLGNPTLLGLMGFLVPFTNTMLVLLEFQGSNANSLAAICGPWYFFGGIAMVIAGLCEFILGNTFPFTVFIICKSSARFPHLELLLIWRSWRPLGGNRLHQRPLAPARCGLWC